MPHTCSKFRQNHFVIVEYRNPVDRQTQVNTKPFGGGNEKYLRAGLVYMPSCHGTRSPCTVEKSPRMVEWAVPLIPLMTEMANCGLTACEAKYLAVLGKNIWGAWPLIIWEATTAKRNLL